METHDVIIDPNASKEVAMTSLDWCARSRQLSLLKAVLSAHFSHCAISDLQRECAIVLRHAVTSGCRDAVTSLLRHVDDAFLLRSCEEEGTDDDGGGSGSGGGDDGGRGGGGLKKRTMVDKLLSAAVDCGHREVAEVLIQKGARVNEVSFRGKPLLHLSLSLRHLHVTELLIEQGADVNMIDSKEETALFVAVALDERDKMKNDILEKLITRGADVHHRSATGRQPIHNAALSPSSSFQTLSRLAQAGCDVSARDDVMGDTPLHLACARCNPEAVVTLIQHGADFNCENNQGQTPLRKLLQHTTRVSRDFHHQSRMKLAKVLVKLGFRLEDSIMEACHDKNHGYTTIKTTSCSSQRTENRRFPSQSKSSRFLSSRHLCEKYQNATIPSRTSSSEKEVSPDLTNSKTDALCKNGSHLESCCCQCSWRRKLNPTSSQRGGGGRGAGRDKVLETFKSLSTDRAVPALQHLCRMEVRGLLPKVKFQERVQTLEVSSHLHQYLLFQPGLLDDTLGWRS